MDRKKERENTIETKKNLEAFKAKTISLRSEKAELDNKLVETESTITYLKRTQKELETTLEEKQNQINRLAEKAAESTASNLQLTTLTELLKEKEAKIEEMRHQLLSLQPSENTAAETNIASRNDNALNYKKENVTSEDVQLEEHSTAGSEDSVQSKETEQRSNVEVKDQELESTNGKQLGHAGNGKLGENTDEIEGKEHVPENGSAENLQNPQNGYEQQLTSAGLKLAGKNEDAKMRPRRGRRTKTKSRRWQRVSTEKELEKHDSMHFDISQNDENQVRKEENADPNKEEIYRKDTDFSNSQMNMLENSQVTGNSIVRDGCDKGDASNSNEQMLLRQHESMETVVNSHDNEVSETSLESKGFLQVDDSKGVRYDTDDNSELDDKKQNSVSNSVNVEMPDDSQEKTQNPEGDEGLQDHEEDSLDETALTGEEQEMTSSDGKQENSDDPHENGNENKSNDDEGRIIPHSLSDSKSDAEGQNGIIEQTRTVNTISDPSQTEANSNIDDHQSKTTEKITETVDISNIGDAKDEEDKGIKENTENNSSNNMAEF